ncbi:MAG: DUF4147 domain-containing protein, partial [Candidatus Aminicenantes bacterium]|nr:DUF4147 domain-containing protein [Candidatus Aminicenantes bacterium]NIM80645.1 DUF4147 domain-containing protein [Candidatus Aminicenantes bacterium]NIN20026.1 DUF4147 domain-containing protein [Candidatus Aminicenantes bacterium]NIN43814.1 DUF4147 domain-containing protein [Candidatus Aminicenantes bacterium]NIN86624.1 DUF4147 domain-containing protein [Candidatus Aminicenantes bacterium]
DRRFDLDRFDKVHVVGVGKGTPFLFEGLDNVLGSRIDGGVIVSLEDHAFSHDRVKFYAGSHPLPDQRSLDAGKAVTRYIENNVRNRDLVFFLITGGASALMVQPAPGIELEDKIEINKLLLACGAEINEINCVRKHMSALKGGKLARLVYPARLVSLILSDIVGSPLGAIGSGPSIYDSTPVSQAFAVLQKYKLIEKLPPAVRDFFQRASSPVDIDLSKNVHFLLGDNRVALEAARSCAQGMGIHAHIITSRDKGEASEAAKIYAAIVKEIIYTKTPFKPPVLLLSGGELTVTLAVPPGKKTGKGGRNQAFVLHMLKELKEITHPFCLASLGTDGLDGPTDAAGAWIDRETKSKVRQLGLDMDDYLECHDSYHFFQKIDQHIKTGPTRTNVMDLRMFYIQ